MEQRNCGYIVKSITAVLFGILVLGGCGNLQDSEKEETLISYSETQDGVAEDGDGEEDAGEDIGEDTEESAGEDAGDGVGKDTGEGLGGYEQEPEYQQEIPTEAGSVMEIYNGRDVISVTEDIMIAQVLPEEVLKGNPVIYDRFRVDGWVFEWLVSDYQDDDDPFSEDGVLVVSREGDNENAQVISVKAEDGYAPPVSVEHKFEYVDVNFDGLTDLLICTGRHGNDIAVTYYCFLQTDNGFVEDSSFTEILNPSIDEENQLILSQWRNTCAVVNHTAGGYMFHKTPEYNRVTRFHGNIIPMDRLGQTFSEILNHVRMEQAKQLLGNPSLRIGDIAEAVGFPDMAHFSRVFKKQEGISANEYRNTVSVPQKEE